MTFTLIFKDISEERDIPKENYTIKDLLNDSRIVSTSKFITELAYSFYTKHFSVHEISSTRKLDTDTRNFIINILNFVYLFHL